MRTTTVEFEKKLTNCANDFWAFYLQNKARVDSIIIAQTHRFGKTLDLDDMTQDILLLLIKNDFLGSYNSDQSGIFTYLTNKVRGYAWHLYTLSHPNPWKPSYRSKDRKAWEQVLFYNLNGTEWETKDRHQSHELPDKSDFWDSWESEYSCQEIVEGIKGRMSPRNQKIVDMLVEGLTAREISDALGVTPQAVVYRMKKIRAAFRHAVQEEFVTV